VSECDSENVWLYTCKSGVLQQLIRANVATRWHFAIGVYFGGGFARQGKVRFRPSPEQVSAFSYDALAAVLYSTLIGKPVSG